MAMLVLHRNFILRTTKGHSIQFLKGVPVPVPPTCVADAVAIGAVPPEGGSVDVLEPESKPGVELTPEQREAELFKAFAILEARSDRGDFTASNQPHCKKLQAITGWEVPTGERDDAWRKYRVQQGEAQE
jgi:hypothetical protein